MIFYLYVSSHVHTLQWTVEFDTPFKTNYVSQTFVQCNYVLFFGIVICNSSLKATDAVLELIFLNNLRSLHILACFQYALNNVFLSYFYNDKNLLFKTTIGKIT